jgi:hypothetical protein
MSETDCDCVQRLREIAKDRIAETRNLLEHELPKRLDVFTGAMREGAIQLIARRLLRAGAHRAKLDKGMGGQVSPDDALRAVPRVVSERPLLSQFIATNADALREQVRMVDPQTLHVKARREKFKESLGGRIDAELDAAERLLKQLDQLEKRLPTWKSYARSAETPRMEIVTDIHESET